MLKSVRCMWVDLFVGSPCLHRAFLFGKKDTLFSERPLNQPLVISNYSYDPRLNLQPMNGIELSAPLPRSFIPPISVLERQYTSSNMDDLIDSMARRHLAARRHDVSYSGTPATVLLLPLFLLFRHQPTVNESVVAVTIHITVGRLFVMKETLAVRLRCNRIGCCSSASIISKSTT